MKKLSALFLVFVAIFTAFLLASCDDKGGDTPPLAGECEHTWGEWTTVREATCGKAGEKKHICTLCQKEAAATISATGNHNYVSGTCTVCDVKLVAETEHFSVTEPMFSFAAYYQYLLFVNTYKEIGVMEYIRGVTGDALDITKPLEGQVYSRVDGKTTTWYEYFVSSANVESHLALSEQAYACGISLDGKELKTVAAELQRALYGTDAEAGYFIPEEMSFVEENEALAMLQLRALSGKMFAIKLEEFKNSVTADDLNEYYEEHSHEFDEDVDYILPRSVGHILFKNSTYEGLVDIFSLSAKERKLAKRLVKKGEIVSAKNMAKELLLLLK